MNTGSEHILPKANAYKPIYNITPFTLLDYPDKTACIFWFAGCNMRCLYCYNPEIVLGQGKISFQEGLKFLQTRKNLLDGVVLSGGECTSHRDIVQFAREIKKTGMLVKLDTNGSYPKKIEQLIKERLIDYVALDFKAPPEKYRDITGKEYYHRFTDTYKLLNTSSLTFEVRTTLHSDILNMKDIMEMALFLKENNYKGTYFLQDFFNNTETLGEMSNSRTNYISANEITSVKVVIRN